MRHTPTLVHTRPSSTRAPSSEVEGATIEGVERQSVYKVGEASSEDLGTKRRKEATGAEQDDHVLALLFSKGGEHRG